MRVIIETNDTMRYGDPNCCVLHGRRKVWTRNVTVHGVTFGEYHCPVDGCETTPDFGDARHKEVYPIWTEREGAYAALRNDIRNCLLRE